jgi:hypothetical protein
MTRFLERCTGIKRILSELQYPAAVLVSGSDASRLVAVYAVCVRGASTELEGRVCGLAVTAEPSLARKCAEEVTKIYARFEDENPATGGSPFARDALLGLLGWLESVATRDSGELAAAPVTIMNIIDAAMNAVTDTIDDVAVWNSAAMREEIERQERVRLFVQEQPPEQWVRVLRPSDFARSELAALLARASGGDTK